MYKSGFVNRMMKEWFVPGEAMDMFSVVVPIGPGEDAEEVSDTIRRIKEYEGVGEVIAVCNGAPRGTYEAASGVADRTLHYGKPLGYSGARNKGNAAAKYSIVAFVDAETKVSREVLKEAHESIRRGCVGGMARVEPDMETNGETQFYNWTSTAGKYLTKIWDIPVIGKYFPTVGNGQFIYCRRDISLKFDESLGTQEDVDFVRQMREYGSVNFIDDLSIKTSGRRFRKEGAFLSWAKRAKKWLNYTNGETESLSGAPEPVLQAA